MYTGEPSNGARNVRVTRPTGGSFTRGNRSSTYLGREWTPGLLAPISSRPDRFFPPVEKTAATLRAERIERKTAAAKPCPGCGMKCYIPKTCFCW